MKIKRKFKKNKKLVLLGLLMLCLLSVGYASFQTTLNLNVSGHVVCSAFGVSKLKENVITSGDGLYVDNYEVGRYVYRGSNPSNYIDFDGDLWRIVAIENDNVLKIIKNDVLGPRVFDGAKRISDNNTYCSDLYNGSKCGCNAWAGTDGIYTNGSKSGTVTENASLNDYLNGDYYSSLPSKLKNNIVSYKFYNGGVSASDTYDVMLIKIKSDYWSGNIALPSIGDFYKASLSNECNENINNWYTGQKGGCFYDNYLSFGNIYWLLNPILNISNIGSNILVSFGNSQNFINSAVMDSRFYVAPVTHLKSSVKLCGDGTSESPYYIISK